MTIIIGAMYFGYFNLAEYLSISQTNLYKHIFQKTDFVDPIGYE